ncbi:MAG: enoyl-CoA hydratase/isomerase family protein [Nocardia sp.]|nr:enoyl-CoA hydratase/isomerase family protein [Nocardia sp.]
MSAETVLIENSGGVRTLTLNRPHRKNAVTTEMWRTLAEVFESVHAPDVRAVILTGSGGNFSSGADIADTTGRGSFPDPGDHMRAINDVVRRLYRLPVPTIAKVRGVAAGAGWNLALGCDLVVATPEARFCQIFTKRALSPDCGGSWILPKLAGLQQAKRLTLLAEMIDAAEARSLGLVTWVRAEDRIDAFAAETAARLAAGSPLALSQTKALVNDGATSTLDAALDSELRSQTANLAGPDVLEAFAAFAAKRDPDFTGARESGG